MSKRVEKQLQANLKIQSYSSTVNVVTPKGMQDDPKKKQ